jgi:hypothetical protein
MVLGLSIPSSVTNLQRKLNNEKLVTAKQDVGKVGDLLPEFEDNMIRLHVAGRRSPAFKCVGGEGGYCQGLKGLWG